MSTADSSIPFRSTGCRLARVMMSVGKAADARWLIRATERLDSAAAEMHFILGDSLMNQQQPEQAVESLRKAVGLRPDYPAAEDPGGHRRLRV